MTKGIDISQWQEYVDFQKIKPTVDFIILREGYRKSIDPYFLQYVKGCQKHGIPIVGVYHFCYAMSSTEAREEAKSCISNIEKAGLGKDVIVFFDFEYDSVKKAKDKGVILGRNECILFTNTFCDYVQSQGYRAGVYSNMDYYKTMYDKATIDKYVFWLADYTGQPDVPCAYHQYTESGTVPGINGKVDMNYYYGGDNTMDLWTKTAELMASQSGYLEKASNSKLDDKTGNAGSGNYTKYARDINNLGLMGCNGQPWCAVYQFWVCVQVFGKAKALEIMGDKFYNCNGVKSHAKSKGTWHTTPKLGALVIFRNGAHIGRVTKVTSTHVYTNEGNTSAGGTNNVVPNGGCVADKVYTRDYSGIDGYVWIDYGTDTATAPAQASNLIGDCTVTLHTFLKGAEDAQVRTIQILLSKLGYKGKDGKALDIDGSLGDNTAYAIEKFQRAQGMTGINFGTVAAKTWTALINAR